MLEPLHREELLKTPPLPAGATTGITSEEVGERVQKERDLQLRGLTGPSRQTLHAKGGAGYTGLRRPPVLSEEVARRHVPAKATTRLRTNLYPRSTVAFAAGRSSASGCVAYCYVRLCHPPMLQGASRHQNQQTTASRLLLPWYLGKVTKRKQHLEPLLVLKLKDKAAVIESAIIIAASTV